MCISPKAIKVHNKYDGINNVVSVPCGHCYECVRKRKLDWEIRISVESSAAAHTFFGMLTYNDEFYHSDVQVSEIQYFIKRLRYNLDKFYPGCKLKYFIVSEYGELKDRLHFHVLYMLSEEFTDTHREFEHLCQLSWVKKVALTDVQKSFRRSVWKRYSKTHKDKDCTDYIDMRRWSRRKYDDISLGFVSAQMLKHGSAVGSIHYACKYLQKQYNRRFSSHLGYDVWRNYMISSGQFLPTHKVEHIRNNYCANKAIYTEISNYPTFPIRGKSYPVPRRWMINSVGKGYTRILVRKLVDSLINQSNFIDEQRLASYWHKEPERLVFLAEKDISDSLSRIEMSSYRERFDTLFPRSKLEKEWQTIMIPEPTPNYPVEVSSTCPIETLFL